MRITSPGRTDALRERPSLRCRVRTAAPLALVAAAVLLVATPASAQSQDPQPVPAQRVVVEYEEGSFSILSQTYLRKVLPAPDELPRGDLGEPTALSGFWYEVLGDGSVRYRRLTENPIIVRFEGVDPENPEAPIERLESLPDRSVFTVLLPYFGPEVQQELVLFSSPLEPGRQHLAASEIARLPLGIPDGWDPPPVP
jgi:hypothetical protein